MTATRYIILVRPVPADLEPAARFAERRRSIPDLHLVFDSGPVSIAATASTPIRLGHRGLILGSVFGRLATRETVALEPDECDPITASCGHHLITHYWGPYIAVITDPTSGRADIIRAPLGELPCYIVHRPGATILASDTDMLAAFGYLKPVVAWHTVVRHLATRDLHGVETCLQDVTELPGGQRMTITASGATTEGLWSPWAFIGRNQRIVQMDQAIEEVGRAARTSIVARAAPFNKAVLMLSGGLDSSIVAAGLVEAGIDVTALTLVTQDAIGDERQHARRVTDHLALPLTEGLRDVSRIDITRSGAERLPRPTVRLFLQESARIASELAERLGAQAFFNGGGGDSVFCSLQSANPAADRLRVSGPGPAFLQTASDIAQLAQASVPAVIADAARRAWLGKPPFMPFRDMSLLSRGVAADIGFVDRHPWLCGPPRALPGESAHVRHIAFAQSYVESLDPQAAIPAVAPLLSQPLVETCLRVPSWHWCNGGLNRAVARQAFAQDLPPQTIARRSKGTPDSFVAEIFETHRASIRDMLADGLLVQQGLIDRAAVLHVLADQGCARGDSFRRVLQFVDVEAWAQGVTGRCKATG